MSQTAILYRTKKGVRKNPGEDPTITLEKLVELGRWARGWAVWRESVPGGDRTLLIFDDVAGDLLSLDDFKEVRRQRARARAAAHPYGGRRASLQRARDPMLR